MNTVLRILEFIKENEEVGVTKLAESLSLPKSTAYGYLNTLKRNEYVQNSDGRYRLGLRFLDLGESARRTDWLYETAKSEVDQLAAETGEVVNLMTEEFGDCVYLYIAQGEKAVQFDTRPGTRVPLYCTALGKVTLAHLPEPRREALVNEITFDPITEHTITDASEFREELDQISERGIAFDRQERAMGIHCMAAPIQVDNEYVGAISITGPIPRMRGERFTQELPDTLADAASVIQLRLRYE